MIYAVSPIIQEKEVTKYCFGECMKIIIGGVEDTELGPLCPCREDDCPYEEKHTEVIGTVKGEKVCVRKLKPLKE